MSQPRYSKDELWERFVHFVRHTTMIKSLTGKSSHKIAHLDEFQKTYDVEYNSGNIRKVKLDDLYNLYKELYGNQYLDSPYMTQNHKRILGWSDWHAPGSAMMAILPHLDDDIKVERGKLYILPT